MTPHGTGVNFISRNNIANLGSFAKISVPVESIILKQMSRSKGSVRMEVKQLRQKVGGILTNSDI